MMRFNCSLLVWITNFESYEDQESEQYFEHTLIQKANVFTYLKKHKLTKTNTIMNIFELY